MQRGNLLYEAVPRLVASLSPERIWLYGSRARGDDHEDSDWDLMVVVPGNGPVSRRRIDAASAAIEDLPGTIDLHVEPHGWFHDRLHLRASFPSVIAREGIILWQGVDLAADDARMWLGRARASLRAADELLATAEAPLVPTAAALLQEAARNAAKAVLAVNDTPVSGTHELATIAWALRGLEPEAARTLASLRYPARPNPLFRYPSESVRRAVEMARLRRAARDLVDLAAGWVDAGRGE